MHYNPLFLAKHWTHETLFCDFTFIWDLKIKQNRNPLTCVYLFCIAPTKVNSIINSTKVRKKLQRLILVVTSGLTVKKINQKYFFCCCCFKIWHKWHLFYNLFLMFTDFNSGTISLVFNWWLNISCWVQIMQVLACINREPWDQGPWPPSSFETDIFLNITLR